MVRVLIPVLFFKIFVAEVSLDPESFLKESCPGRLKNISLGTMKQSNKVQHS